MGWQMKQDGPNLDRWGSWVMIGHGFSPRHSLLCYVCWKFSVTDVITSHRFWDGEGWGRSRTRAAGEDLPVA